MNDARGRPVPGLASAAKQMGKYVGKLITARVAGRSVPPFRYRHEGSLATIGRRAAVVELGHIQLTGFIGWMFWSAVHIYFFNWHQESFRSRGDLAVELRHIRARGPPHY